MVSAVVNESAAGRGFHVERLGNKFVVAQRRQLRSTDDADNFIGSLTLFLQAQKELDGITTFHDFDVSQNSFSVTHLQQLFQMLSELNVHIERLRIFGTATLNDEACSYVGEWLASVRTETAPLELHLSDCAISDAGFKAMMAALADNNAFPLRKKRGDENSGIPLFIRIENNYIPEMSINAACSEGVAMAFKKTSPAGPTGKAKCAILVADEKRQFSQKSAAPPDPGAVPVPKPVRPRVPPQKQTEGPGRPPQKQSVVDSTQAPLQHAQMPPDHGSHCGPGHLPVPPQDIPGGPPVHAPPSPGTFGAAPLGYGAAPQQFNCPPPGYHGMPSRSWAAPPGFGGPPPGAPGFFHGAPPRPIFEGPPPGFAGAWPSIPGPPPVFQAVPLAHPPPARPPPPGFNHATRGLRVVPQGSDPYQRMTPAQEKPHHRSTCRGRVRSDDPYASLDSGLASEHRKRRAGSEEGKRKHRRRRHRSGIGHADSTERPLGFVVDGIRDCRNDDGEESAYSDEVPLGTRCLDGEILPSIYVEEMDGLPADWEKHWDETYETYYYWNATTGVSSWELPEDLA